MQRGRRSFSGSKSRNFERLSVRANQLTGRLGGIASAAMKRLSFAALVAMVVAFGCGGALAKQKPKPKPNPGALVKTTIRTGLQPCGLAFGFGSVWINGFGTDSVERVDPQALKLTAHIPVGKGPFDVLVAAG